MKNLVIKTASNIIYLANGKVSCVRDRLTGKFVKIAKFANIINNLVVAAKAENDSILATTSHLTMRCTLVEKLIHNRFKSLKNLAKVLLGDCQVIKGNLVRGLDALAYA